MNYHSTKATTATRIWTSCLAALAVGCSGASEQFFIVQNQVPQDGCVIPGTRSAIYRGTGVLDVGLVSADALSGYRLFPLLQNDLPARGQTGATEPNRLSLSEFRVWLAPGAGAPQALIDLFATPALVPYLSFSQPWSGSIDPGGGNLSAGVTVVPAEVARSLSASGILDTLAHVPLMAKVTAVGSTLSDTVESRSFEYPISACKGCLIASLTTCPHTPVNTGNSCNIAQDNSVDCCTDGATLVCPSRAPN